VIAEGNRSAAIVVRSRYNSPVSPGARFVFGPFELESGATSPDGCRRNGSDSDRQVDILPSAGRT